jgi:hypothetical protein
VVHPAFLLSDELGDALGRPGADLALPGGGSFETPGAEDEPLAVTPQDRDHLRALVDQALVPVFGEPPHHDGDGDVPVRAGSAMVFVQVPEHAPVVQLFSVVVVGVSDRERAAFEVAVLNRDQRFVTFVLSDDTVLAYVTIPGLPFAPEHLRAMLSLTVEMVDRVDDDLVARVGGHRWFDDEPEDASGDALGSAAEPGVAILDSAGEDDDELGCGDDVEEEWTGGHSTEPAVHPAMMTLLQLDAASPGSITPELAASICESDRDLLLALIGWNGEEEAEWQRGRDAARAVGDAAEAETCEQARRHAAATVGLLRGALRLVVEARLRADREQLVAGPVAPDGVASGPADASSALPGPHQRQDPFPAGAVMSRLNRTRPAPWDPGSPARRRRLGRRQDVLPGLEVPDSEPGLRDGSDGSED